MKWDLGRGKKCGDKEERIALQYKNIILAHKIFEIDIFKKILLIYLLIKNIILFLKDK